MKTRMTYAPALLAVLLAGAVQAQEPPEPPPAPTPAPRRPPIPLQVQIVLTRTQAGKAVSRLPYTLSCTAPTATLRMGVEVPVSVGFGKGIQYRNVGVNIDCMGESLGDGVFKLRIAVEQSSISDIGRVTPKTRGADAPAGEDAPEAGNPVFRTFNSTFIAILRDGQGALHTAATDPVSGEEVTIEVTLKALK
jgi:hypothetical protein